MKVDIFDIDGLNSLVRRAFAGLGEIKLSETSLVCVPIPETFSKIPVRIEKEHPGTSIRSVCEQVASTAEQHGFGYNLFTAVYEAVKNAYEHGNNHNPDLPIDLAYLVGEDRFDVMVQDAGGTLDPNFLAYVERYRRGEHRKQVIDFYEFSGKEKQGDNQGTGVHFMFTYLDDLFFYRSVNDGLLVHMVKLRSNP